MSRATEEQRVYAGWPSRRETLMYYLEDLIAALEKKDEARTHDVLSPDFDRDFYSNGRYRYYEVLNAGRTTVQDLLSAIAEVKEKLRMLDIEEGIDSEDAPIEGQVILLGFLPATYPEELCARAS